jgi:hypothetical protein
VGLVYLGIATAEMHAVRHKQLQPDHAVRDRAAVREGAAFAALAWLVAVAARGL